MKENPSLLEMCKPKMESGGIITEMCWQLNHCNPIFDFSGYETQILAFLGVGQYSKYFGLCTFSFNSNILY